MNKKAKMMAAILGGSTNLDFFKKDKEMSASKITVSNFQLRDMASKIVEAVKPEVCGSIRCTRLMGVAFAPTISFYDNPEDNSVRVEVWINKEKIAEQSYHSQSAESWDQLDTRLEVSTHRGLIKYFYNKLLSCVNLRLTIKEAMQAGNKTVKLPNGQTLTSEILRVPRDLSVGLRQVDDYPIFSAPVDVNEEALDHILGNVVYHWTDPGLLAPVDHFIEIPSEAFDA